MPFVFLILGVGLLVVAVKGTHQQFFTLLKSEFTGSNNFIVWVMAIAVLGALGFIKPIRPIALGFIVLVFLVMILKNGGGFFSQLNSQVANPTAPSAAPGGGSGSIVTNPFAPGSGNSLLTPQGTPSQLGPASQAFPWLNPSTYEQFGTGYTPAA